MDEGERTHCRQDRDTAASRPDWGSRTLAPWRVFPSSAVVLAHGRRRCGWTTRCLVPRSYVGFRD
jgi:hypothetical protein